MTSATGRDAISRHLTGILASPAFARSKRLGAFLSWIVSKALADERSAITERNIALEVYARRPDFDAKIDGTIRVEAMRLRHKLREYYDGAPSDARIEIPKGAYAPLFIGFEKPPVAAAEMVPAAAGSMRRGGALLLGLAAVLLACAGCYFYLRTAPSGDAAQLLAAANRLRLIGDNLPAAALLHRAAAIAPNATEVHLARAAVFQNLGLDNQARTEAVEAEDLAALHGEAAPDAAARLRSLDLDVTGAMERVRAMLRKQPDSMGLWQDLAQLEDYAGEFEEALAAINRPRQLPDAAPNPELDRLEALTLGGRELAKPIELRKTDSAIALVLRGQGKAAALHADSALGRLMLLEGGLHQISLRGQAAGALSLQRAREFCLSIHDDICVARRYRVDANRFYYDGRYQEALRSYRQGLVLVRRRGNLGETRWIMNGISDTLAGLNEHLTAAELEAQAFELLGKNQR